jgi:hypothetical protein
MRRDPKDVRVSWWHFESKIPREHRIDLEAAFNMFSDTTGNRRFANNDKLLAKTPILLAKAFPTGLARSYWESTVGVLSDGKELFANRNAGPVGKASPTTTCSICW